MERDKFHVLVVGVAIMVVLIIFVVHILYHKVIKNASEDVVVIKMARLRKSALNNFIFILGRRLISDILREILLGTIYSKVVLKVYKNRSVSTRDYNDNSLG